MRWETSRHGFIFIAALTVLYCVAFGQNVRPLCCECSRKMLRKEKKRKSSSRVLVSQSCLSFQPHRHG
jgi:hypothetical protein